ncbi:Druantia anti-phage system protein DruA [Kribbella sp. NPDC023972]|uniref:Druantia anti-phage system protein DruA n=1 Tax=Kribbella sp. NPDC023972 TaxID=3154795 RepID=UPI0033E57A92
MTDTERAQADPKYLPLSLPAGSTKSERQGFRRLCELLNRAYLDPEAPLEHGHWIAAAGLGNLYNRPRLAAAAHTLIDLVDQGWSVEMDTLGTLVAPPEARDDRALEKDRIRRQELLRRDQQLGKPSVRRFIDGMERTHQHGNKLISIFNLMRDGRELANTLAADVDGTAIQPYVQVVDGTSVCELTGFRLHDIWRYFRHTWSNAYQTVPGRSMPMLVRDAATEYHAVIGLAAISSPIVQIAERDHWIEWDTNQFVASVRECPTIEVARWLARRIKVQKSDIYVEDLLRDGVLQPRDLERPTTDVVARLRADAERHRAKHHRGSPVREVRDSLRDTWVERAETHLFRSKRAAALAETLEIQLRLGNYLSPNPTIAGLRRALDDTRARTQIGRVVRRARGERVGTVIADLTVCGAVAPYSALAAGKLVGALAVSPPVLAAYEKKYARPSEIASSMAGRPITREARLAFVGTTSLYGTGSSQYNRLFWPANVMGGEQGVKIGFYELGRSRSFGTSHFSVDTVEALVRLSEVEGSSTRVNSLFGEGVSPRLRKVRLGLAVLGWPTNELLKHGRERILYGVPLVENLREYALGIEREPRYLLDPVPSDEGQTVASWWWQRWGSRRADQERVREAMRTHRLTRPVRHGARVPAPTDDELLSVESGHGRTAASGGR